VVTAIFFQVTFSARCFDFGCDIFATWAFKLHKFSTQAICGLLG
jgi:hypothetical protein